MDVLRNTYIYGTAQFKLDTREYQTRVFSTETRMQLARCSRVACVLFASKSLASSVSPLHTSLVTSINECLDR